LGNDALAPELCVVIVSTVNKPREILAGTASMSNQKDTQDRITMRTLGTYTCNNIKIISNENTYCLTNLMLKCVSYVLTH